MVLTNVLIFFLFPICWARVVSCHSSVGHTATIVIFSKIELVIVQWGPVTFNAPDGAGTQLRYSPRTAAWLRLRCHCLSLK